MSKKILMVCLGNICRSPMAEAILRYKTEKANIRWIIDSAGTADYHIGQPPHPMAIKVCNQYGLDLSNLHGRQFKPEDIRYFDKIFVMDKSNLLNLQNACGERWNQPKVDLILNMVNPGQDLEVPDPWGGPESGYHKVFHLLDEACEAIIKQFGKIQ